MIFLLILLLGVSQSFGFTCTAPKFHDNSSSLKSSSKKEIHVLSSEFSASLLKDYWGKRPVLIRKGFSLPQPAWPSWDLIEEIASYDEAESRLISHVPKDLSSFSLDLGPFRDLSSYLEEIDSRKRWTLVVNDVDRFHPTLADWMDSTFDFIPRWRRDDAQVSLAPKDGGIGPHVDNYDVFLIQTRGKREWRIGYDSISIKQEFDSLIDEIPVRILKNWEDTSACSFTLEPGDVLYLPPRIPHCGTALTDECITLSVGCRAPSASELVQRVANELSSRVSDAATERFQDHELLQESGGSMELTADVKNKMKDLILHAVNEFLDDEAQYDKTIGELITEPKRSCEEYPVPLDELDPEAIQELGVWSIPHKAIEAVCSGSGSLYRSEGVSVTFSNVMIKEKMKHRLYMNGEMFELDGKDEDDAPVYNLLSSIVTRTPAVSSKVLLPIRHDQRILGLLETLLQSGLLYGSESD